MTDYYRPIARFGELPTVGSFPLAGGLCWFDQIAIHRRGGVQTIILAQDAPSDVLDRLTAPRKSIAGMDMSRPAVMGILNVTPDSFSDGGDFADGDAALSQAQQMQKAGAAIVDIGGESTRPGADVIAPEDEIARTIPVIDAIRAKSAVPVSIDTRKAPVARAAMAAGASLINDVSAFTYDAGMAAVARELDAPVCLMHAQGTPQTMQNNPTYDDVVLDVYDFLTQRIAIAEEAGIDRSRIIVDPGIGFGKTVDHNLALLRSIAVFHGLGCPILLGASRKRFIGALGGGDGAKDRVGGSVATALFAARRGVQILRVHDVFETKQALDVEWAIGGAAMT